jgi:hypothetical protein
MRTVSIIFLSGFLVSLLVACGGGGGGGATTGDGGTPTQPPVTPTSYNKNLDIEELGGSFDMDTGVMSFRTHQETGAMWVSTGDPTAELSLGVDGLKTTKFSRTYSFTPTNASTNLDMSMSFEQVSLADVIYFDVGNDLDGYLYWESDWGLSLSEDSSSSYEWNYRLFGFYSDISEEFLGADYVNIFIADLDYGDDLSSGFDICDVSDSTCIDNIQDKDVLAGAFGDFTQTSDMPTNGTTTYSTKALGFWHPNLLETESSIPHWPAYEGDATITVNFGQGTLSGDITLDYVFPDRKAESSTWNRVNGVSAGTIKLVATISSNEFQGTATWDTDVANYGTGEISGYFFGPDAKELGGWSYVYDGNELDWAEIIMSFLGHQ